MRSKIYIIRGKQVMLDFDLAEIYGYSVKAFNQQVKNNIEKFDDDFRFKLTWEEMFEISKCSRSKFLTLNEKGTRGSNIKYLPYAFTEQGIYMLMTVLRGDLAIKQSKILVRLFKAMKDYIIDKEHLVGYDDVAKLALQTSQNTKDIAEIKEYIHGFSQIEIPKNLFSLKGKNVEADKNNLKIDISDKILLIRGQYVMTDRDLAELYGVETKRLNEQVRRNTERFPSNFMFQLNESEFEFLRSQIATSKTETRGGRQYLPYVFTEQGVAMLSAVLKSDTAVQTSIMIMEAFVALRRFAQTNSQIFQRLDFMEKRQITSELHQLESDRKIDELFDKMDRYKIEDKQGIFFQGQIFDAYAKFESFIAEAEKEIVLIDNYVDLTVLERFAKKKSGVKVTIFTCPKTKITPLDIQKFNEQYPTLVLKYTEKIHDRFLIIDNKILYHIGASLKDLGKKCFAFEILDSSWITEIMRNL
ncbi:ORF6N domain-containing protein [bacterium]|nr:ORF6N domain-containing protein [bacterium]